MLNIRDLFKIGLISLVLALFSLSLFSSVSLADSDNNDGDDLTSIYSISGPFELVATGGTFRTKSNDEDCTAVTDSSTAQLSLPTGAQVEKAFLFWAASDSEIDDTVTLNGSQVMASSSNCHLSEYSGVNGLSFYGCYADVTDLVKSYGSGTYTLTDLTINTGSPWSDYCTVLGGWSLIVIYKESNSTDMKYIHLYEGFKIVHNNSFSKDLTGFIAADNPSLKVLSIVWEGDPDLNNNEELEINGHAAGTNLFDSNSTAIPKDDTYGVDIDSVDASQYVNPGDTSLNWAFSTGQDLVIVSALAIYDLKVTGFAGHVYEDPNGDGNMDDKKPVEGVKVKLFSKEGDLKAETTTDSNGYYYFANLNTDDYYVVVDSKTVSPVEGLNSGYTQGDVWAEQTYVNAPSNGDSYAKGLCDTDADSSTDPEQVSGSHVCFGGSYGSRSDDASDLDSAEHKALIHVGLDTLANVDFGFSFNVVTNVNDRDDDSDNGRTCQGCLRQFIQNANAISGSNYMHFVPAVPENSGNWWTVVLNLVSDSNNLYALPPIKDSGTTVDGTAYSYQDGTTVRDTNTGSVSAPGTVGVDQTSLSPYEKPELEVDGNSKGSVFTVDASNVDIEKVAVFNTGWDTGKYPSAVKVLSGSSVTVSDCFLGAKADGSLPDVDKAAMEGIHVRAGADVHIDHNYIAGEADAGISMEGTGIMERNYISHVGRSAQCADGISFEFIKDSPTVRSRDSVVVRDNYIEKSAAYGVESWGTPGAYTISDNTIVESGRGNENGDVCGDGNLNTTELGGVRLFGSGSLVEKNVIHDNPGSGVVVVALDSSTPSKQNTITQNIFYNNGGISIDLDQTHIDGTGGSVNPNGDGVTPNDGSKNSGQQNAGLDYPVFTTAVLNGNTLHLEGYVGTESSKIQGMMTVEVYKADDDGNNNGEVFEGDGKSVSHGEGHWYLGSCTTDNDGTFSCDIDVSGKGLSVGDEITGTATDSDGNTSEFSADTTVSSQQGGYTVSGYVYNDINHSSTRESSEGGMGSGVTVYVKLCQNGNVVQVAVPDPNTGEYQFTDVQEGSYEVLESPDNGDSCSEGAPTGWIPTTGLSQNISVSSNLSGVNFGNYHGEKVCGYVFNDRGDGSSSSSDANDAVFESSTERGISGVTVRVCTDADCSSPIDTTTTDSSGSYCLWIPSDFDSETVYIVETDPSGYVSTGDSVGSDVSANFQNASVERNRLELTVSSGSTVENYNFGDVGRVQVEPPQSYVVSPGSTVTINHAVNLSTPGKVAVLLTSKEGWSYTVYTDEDCDGNPDALVPMNDGYFELTGDSVSAGRVCFVIRTKVPSSASGHTEKLDVTVFEDWKNTSGNNGNTGSVYDDSSSLTDTITVNLAQSGILKLSKWVRNVNRGEGFSTSNRAKPCEYLEYRIDFKNVGAQDVVNLVISDVISDDVSLVTKSYDGEDVKLYIEGKEFLGSVEDSPDTDGVILIGNTLEVDVNKLTDGEFRFIKPNQKGSIYYTVRLKGDCQ